MRCLSPLLDTILALSRTYPRFYLVVLGITALEGSACPFRVLPDRGRRQSLPQAASRVQKARTAPVQALHRVFHVPRGFITHPLVHLVLLHAYHAPPEKAVLMGLVCAIARRHLLECLGHSY